MSSQSQFQDSPSFCGNCGAAVTEGSRTCGACGQPLAGDIPQTDLAPADYIPYCRRCGSVVPWGQGHTCRRCGVEPLCSLHFQAADGLCLDCASLTAHEGAEAPIGGLSCGACGAAISPDAGFCANCGRPFAVATGASGSTGATGRSGASAPNSATGEYIEYMGFWIRTGAYVIDWIASYVVALLLSTLMGISLTSAGADPVAGDDISVIFDNFNFQFLILFWVISVAHSLLMTIWRGQTLGKMILRIQVVDADGNVPPVHRLLAREALRAIVLVALFPLGFMYAWVAMDTRKRGPQDYLGGCFVVRRRGRADPPSGIF